jgi:hypothetical protein
MPRPLAIEAASAAESVLRLWKLTSFSMVAFTRAADTSFTAATIWGSAGALGARTLCWATAVETATIPSANDATHFRNRAMVSSLKESLLLPRRPGCASFLKTEKSQPCY